MSREHIAQARERLARISSREEAAALAAAAERDRNANLEAEQLAAASRLSAASTIEGLKAALAAADACGYSGPAKQDAELRLSVLEAGRKANRKKARRRANLEDAFAALEEAEDLPPA